jgi:hypothetical protein
MFDNEASNRDNDAVLDAQEPETAEATVYIVAKYRMSQRFGGPEEGGWWYTEHDFEKVVVAFTYEPTASAACRRLNDKVDQNPNGGSVYMVVEIPRWDDDEEESPKLRTDVPLHLPEHRPHYC